jgi:hypothetical protein
MYNRQDPSGPCRGLSKQQVAEHWFESMGNPTVGLRNRWVHIAGMGAMKVTPRGPTDPVVHEHTYLIVRPLKGVTYKQVLHPKQTYFELAFILNQTELVYNH